MLAKTKGIILRSLKYGESSLILDIYTEDYGLNSYIVGGVRSKKSKTKAGGLQLMSLVNVLAYHKGNKSLFRIKEINAVQLFRRIPFEILRSSVGMFMVEVLKNTLREAEENKALFDFLFESFTYLDETDEKTSNLHLKFMLDFTEFIGIQPRDNYSMNNAYFDLVEGQFISGRPDHKYFLDQEGAELLYDLMMHEKESVHEFEITNAQRRFLLDNLILFYNLHIESMKALKTYQILNEILA